MSTAELKVAGEIQKVFVSYIDESRKRFFLAIENGVFYRLGDDRTFSRLNYSELLKVLFGLSNKRFKMQGFGYYGKSILAK